MNGGVVIEEVTDQQNDSKNSDAHNCNNIFRAAEEQVTRGTEESGERHVSEEASLAREATLEDDEARRSLEAAEAIKLEGNTLYSSGNYEAALDKYDEAANIAPETAVERAIYFGNKAACYIKLEQFAEAAHECSAALDINPNYAKVLLRRSSAYEGLDDLERALADAQKAMEIDPDNKVALSVIRRLEPIVQERREKMKEEMLGKLKELGNSVLGKFGMSLDNFKAEKDPSTGSYSIKYQQT